MLRIIENRSAAGAMSYYSTADYYSQGQELEGRWRGEGAERLGLNGVIAKEDWDALCDNRNPATGEKLTLRQKKNRRVGYDFNFHVPKSVSLLYSLTKDERILDAFRDSVHDTMQDMEAEMKARVRKGGKDEDRITGNMVWGEFVHFTARPVGGVPDPHLHAHCFVHSATWDDQENAWKAGQFADLKRDGPYFEAVFHSRMARRLADLGLGIERTRSGWDVAGIPKPALARFSRRTEQIEAEAKRKGIVDPDAKSELGAKTREAKNKELSAGELQAEWESRLSAGERAAIAAVGEGIGGQAIREDPAAAAQAVRYAADHWFERKSVVPERTLKAEALKHAVGKAGPEAVEDAFQREDLVIGERDGRRMVTTRSVLSEEMRMVGFARDGRGTESKLGDTSHAFKRDWLGDGQRRAVLHVLGSRDRVTLIRGAAGTGKTTMMQEAVEAIEANGNRVFTFAPSADASRGTLRSEGFENADTVAKLLADERLQAEIAGQVIWIDEAGLLGSKTMANVFDLAERIDARVILSGDRRQHGSVERGAALRLLEEEAGLMPAEIKEIQRQKSSYKQAVQSLSEGKTEDGFRQLDRLGWVREVPDDERYRMMAAEYVGAVADKKTALVVSPTHSEGGRITGEIRRELKKLDRLGEEEHGVLRLTPSNLTEAERGDQVNYFAGDVLEFHQNAKGYRKGDRLAVASGRILPLDQAARFQVYRRGTLDFAAGDVVRVTKNGSTADGKHRLNNGARFTVRGFTKSGDLVLQNGWTVAKNFGHLDYGYVVTSHASQSKTVDRVFIGQSAESYPASSREQAYVSISRGMERAVIFTDDKEALLEAISKSDDRLTATEFVNLRQRREHGAKLREREQAVAARDEHVRREQESITYDR
ncbi:MAG: MobF family relaxase [Thermoguttaceae bacterium]